MAKSPKARPVCFKTRAADVVTFDAKHSRAYCPQLWETQYGVVRKVTNADELRALRALNKAGSAGVPRLLYGVEKPGKRAEVRMTNVGTALTDLPGRRGGGGQELVSKKSKRLRADLRRALQTMKDAGVLHHDMAPRNVTWDGHNFHVIDFDIVSFQRDWDVDAELDEALDVLQAWAAKRK